MTDRELLELAAKAAGYDLFFWSDRAAFKDFPHATWSPLTDDGDALRLSIDLELNVFHAAGCAYAMPSEDDGSNEHRVSYVDAGDKHQATRLAILLAAAEIGRAMP